MLLLQPSGEPTVQGLLLLLIKLYRFCLKVCSSLSCAALPLPCNHPQASVQPRSLALGNTESSPPPAPVVPQPVSSRRGRRVAAGRSGGARPGLPRGGGGCRVTGASPAAGGSRSGPVSAAGSLSSCPGPSQGAAGGGPEAPACLWGHRPELCHQPISLAVVTHLACAVPLENFPLISPCECSCSSQRFPSRPKFSGEYENVLITCICSLLPLQRSLS